MDAAKLFNQINALYPNKPDLRKTKEFINWKRDLHGLPGIDKRERRKPIRPVIYQPICVNNCMTQPQSVQSVSEKVMELRIPLINTPRIRETLLQQGTDISNDEVLDEGTSEPSFPEQVTDSSNDEVLDQGTSEPSFPEHVTDITNDEVLDQSTTQPSTFGDIPPDTVQKIITELRADSAIANIMDDFEAFENGISNDEVLDEGTIHPAAFDDIPPDTVQKIITELRADPAIANIMDDVVTDINNGDAEQSEIHEAQSEFDFDLGMEIEIDDRLERELEDTVYW